MKRKSTAYRIVQALFLVAIVMFLPITVWAQETTLTTVIPSSHSLHLELTGEGTIVVDGVAYTQSADIQIQRKSRPEISLQISDENQVKSVLWGGEDITASISKGSWTMPEVIEDVMLTVTFEKTSSAPQTGEVSQPTLWFAIAALSWIGMIICWLMRKKQKR